MNDPHDTVWIDEALRVRQALSALREQLVHLRWGPDEDSGIGVRQPNPPRRPQRTQGAAVEEP